MATDKKTKKERKAERKAILTAQKPAKDIDLKTTPPESGQSHQKQTETTVPKLNVNAPIKAGGKVSKSASKDNTTTKEKPARFIVFIGSIHFDVFRSG